MPRLFQEFVPMLIEKRAVKRLMQLATVLTSSMVLFAQAPSQPSQGNAAVKPAAASAPFRNQPSRLANRARAYYGMVWGVEELRVKVVESGEMIRFTYRVVDPEKAKPLNDKKIDPALICPDKGVKLIIPTLEKVGQLRQTANPEAGRAYWMAFSNKGGIIKRGDRVDVVIGSFHAEALEVE
jgi:hypothetical protein